MLSGNVAMNVMSNARRELHNNLRYENFLNIEVSMALSLAAISNPYDFCRALVSSGDCFARRMAILLPTRVSTTLDYWEYVKSCSLMMHVEFSDWFIEPSK